MKYKIFIYLSAVEGHRSINFNIHVFKSASRFGFIKFCPKSNSNSNSVNLLTYNKKNIKDLKIPNFFTDHLEEFI